MPDFAKALKHMERALTVSGPPPATTDWESQLARYVVAGGGPLTVSARSVLPPGEVHSTALGSHYVIHAVYPGDHFHGKVRLDRLSSADLTFLMTLMHEEGSVPD